MRLHSHIQGEGNPPLVILHGFLGSLDNWRIMSRRLAQSYQVCSLDLRNHGGSPHSDLMTYQAMAQDVHQFIAEHHLTNASVLGHSMGGKVAMQLAAQYPDEIGKLIVVDIAPKAYPPAHKPLLHAMRNVDLPAYKSFGEVSDALTGAIPDPAVRQFILKNLARDSAGNFHWRLGLDEIIENYDELTKAITGERPFTKPACFVRGGRSNFVQDSDFAPIQEFFPRAEFRTIAEAGHWAHVDSADEFYAIVASFLAARSSS